MEKKDRQKGFAETIDGTLERIAERKLPNIFFYFLILILFLVVYIFLTRTARSKEMMVLFGMNVPVSTFAGVFSSLSNVLIIFLVIFFRKRGFITALIIFIIQFPLLIINLIVRHNSISIPGMFMNLFTIFAIGIIHFNNRRIGNYQKKIRYQAVTDTLTGLPNRLACSELVDDLIKQGRVFVLVSINLNNFKGINDTMGHEVGDAILIEIASRWKALADKWDTGTVDFVTRSDGDGFSLIIRGYRFNNEIRKTIDMYRSELERKITIDDCDYFMTASFGYAEYPVDATTATAMISYADAAMHEIKSRNGNEHVLHFTGELIKADQELEIERKIRTALENGTVTFFLQPQYDMSHKLRGFEALARMKDTDGSFINPGVFIPVAEKTGLIDRVDLAVFRQAVEFLRDVHVPEVPDVTVSFNISVRHLMKNNFIEEIKEILQKSHVPAESLELEITESIMIDSAENALKRISEVKEMGMQVAIDDFGTGYSSLSYLNKFPADLLKIDKSFIDEMNTGEASRNYVKSIISIGHVLGLKVISEGVESEDQLETLKSIGCDYIQGYLWGRPMPADEAAKLVAEER